MSIDSDARRIGEIYAQALFSLAQEAQAADAIADDFAVLTNIHQQVKDFATLMAAPFLTEKYKQQVLNEMFRGKLSELTMNFLMVAVEHHRIVFLPQIIARYNELWDKHRGRRHVKVVVSKPMNNDEIERLREDISAALKSKTELELVVNPSIIGGAMIRYDDKVIDNTIRGRLHLAVKMTTNRGRINEN